MSIIIITMTLAALLQLMPHFKWVLKGAGFVLALILVIKIFIIFDIKDLFLPIVGILIPVGMLYHWYSMSYDDEQKKIIKKLKGEK